MLRIFCTLTARPSFVDAAAITHGSLQALCLTTSASAQVGTASKHVSKVPSRPPTAYNIFVKQQHQIVAQKLGTKKLGVLAKELGSMWKNMSEFEQYPYKQRAQELSAQFDSDAAIAERQALAEKLAAARRSPRAPHAYSVFLKEVLPQIKTELDAKRNKQASSGDTAGKHNIGEYSKAASQRWNRMSEEEKDVYRKKADQLRNGQ